jgi:hypothetical protein
VTQFYFGDHIYISFSLKSIAFTFQGKKLGGGLVWAKCLVCCSHNDIQKTGRDNSQGLNVTNCLSQEEGRFQEADGVEHEWTLSSTQL